MSMVHTPLTPDRQCCLDRTAKDTPVVSSKRTNGQNKTVLGSMYFIYICIVLYLKYILLPLSRSLLDTSHMLYLVIWFVSSSLSSINHFHINFFELILLLYWGKEDLHHHWYNNKDLVEVGGQLWLKNPNVDQCLRVEGKRSAASSVEISHFIIHPAHYLL